MNHNQYFLMASLLAMAGLSSSAITVDGTLDGGYGSALATQTVNTQFGNSTVGDGSSSGGSELDAGYGTVLGGYLYVFIAGNIELNYNHINIFISDGRTGQSTLSGLSGGLSPMNGSSFSSGFSATYALDLNGGSGANGTLYVDQYNLVGTPSGSYLGGVTLSGGIGNNTFSGVQIGLNNVNAAGVVGGTGAANQTAANAVTTGLELGIPLSLLGNPTGNILVLADINGGGNNYLSNQFLSGLAAGSDNLGTTTFNFSSTPGQYFTVAVPEPSSLALCGVSGLAALLAIRRRR